MTLELARTPDDARLTIAAALRNPAVADDRRRDHIRIITGPQPYRHSHYSADQFFHVDVEAGVVHNIYGQRVLRVTENYLRTLTAALGDRADQVLYNIGESWGESSVAAFAPRIEQEYEVEFAKLGMSMMLETWWWQFRAAGWGAWRTDFRLARNGLVFIDVFDSIAASAAGRTDQFSCSLYAGLFAAVFSKLANRSLQCLELKCASKGDEFCRFLVATAARVEMARQHRDRGAKSEEIAQLLGNSNRPNESRVEQ